MRAAVLAAFLLVLGAIPARAGTITINSTNCNSSGGCFGLNWQLTINTGTFSSGGSTYGYQAILSVTDDPLVSGTPAVTISAVDFKVSNTVSGAKLYAAPTTLSSWSTGLNGLNSSGCTGSGAGFVCSQSGTAPAIFTASATPVTWGWYFNTSSPLFAGLIGAHIGAKLTTLNKPGHLLSASYYQVPEPTSLSTLGAFGLVSLVAGLRRRRARNRE